MINFSDDVLPAQLWDLDSDELEKVFETDYSHFNPTQHYGDFIHNRYPRRHKKVFLEQIVLQIQESIPPEHRDKVKVLVKNWPHQRQSIGWLYMPGDGHDTLEATEETLVKWLESVDDEE